MFSAMACCPDAILFVGCNKTSKNDSLPFRCRAFEIDQEANYLASDFEVVEHLADFVVSKLVDGLGVNDDRVKTNQIRNIYSDFDVLY